MFSVNLVLHQEKWGFATLVAVFWLSEPMIVPHIGNIIDSQLGTECTFSNLFFPYHKMYYTYVIHMYIYIYTYAVSRLTYRNKEMVISYMHIKLQIHRIWHPPKNWWAMPSSRDVPLELYLTSPNGQQKLGGALRTSHWMGLRDTWNRTPIYFMLKILVSCRFSRRPIHWSTVHHGSMGMEWEWMHQKWGYSWDTTWYV